MSKFIAYPSPPSSNANANKLLTYTRIYLSFNGYLDDICDYYNMLYFLSNLI